MTIHQARKRLGRRGASLLLYGVIWVLNGTLLLTADLSGAYSLISLRIWGGVWFAAGASALWAAWQRTPRQDVVGFTSLAVLALLWAIRSAAVWIVHMTTGLSGDPNGWIAALVWIAVLVKVVIDSGWAEGAQRVD